MTRAEMLAELKAKLRETSVDPAWGDSRLLAMLAEGQDEFCERTGFFIDATTYTITLVADQVSYAVPDRIIEVFSIWYGSRRLGKFQEADRTMVIGGDWDPLDTGTYTGMPTAWQDDKETGYITFNKTPTTDEDGTEFTMRVWRYSTVDLDATGAEPEIPRRYHWAPIHWAASQALLDHDMEKQDKVKASEHRSLFENLVTKGKRHMRRYHGLQTRVGGNLTYRA